MSETAATVDPDLVELLRHKPQGALWEYMEAMAEALEHIAEAAGMGPQAKQAYLEWATLGLKRGLEGSGDE